MRNIRKLFLSFILLLTPFIVWAGGLSCNWGEVLVNNLETGKSYDLGQYAAAPFTLTNNFDDEVPLNLKVLSPLEKELKPGYEALPDPSWVKLSKEEIKIPGLGKGTINITLTVPADSQYAGKKYQFWIWTYTSGKAMGVGLKSRILVTIRK